jgi:hypothetical protein
MPVTDDGRQLPALRVLRPRTAWLEPQPQPQEALAPLLHPLAKEPMFMPAHATVAAANGLPPTARYRVHFKRVALRSGPSRDNLVIGAMDEGSELEACGQEGNCESAQRSTR